MKAYIEISLEVNINLNDKLYWLQYITKDMSELSGNKSSSAEVWDLRLRINNN